MNSWQVVRQMKKLLADAIWPGGDTVLGSVHVTQAPNEEAVNNFRFPLCLISVGSASVDPDFGQEEELLRQRFTVRVLAANANDVIGEATLIGANRTGGSTSSKGRGVLEIEEPVFDAVSRLSGLDGIEIRLKAESAVRATWIQNIGHVAFRDYDFDVLCTANRFYHPPTRLIATDLGGGSVSLTWKLPPNRYDRLRVKLRRAAGATPPATSTAGTGVTLGGDLATSVTDSPGAGTFSYSIFGMYDEYSTTPANEDRESAPESVASVVVT